MNLNDSERMKELLKPSGYEATHSAKDADLILINTCSVREKSKSKVFSALGQYLELKNKNPNLLIGVAGCVAQQEGEQILKAAPFVDLVFSPDHIHLLPELVEEARQTKQIRTGFSEPEDYQFLLANPTSDIFSATAFVTIQKGCDNACAYCIVPLVRGPAICRPADEILQEVHRLSQAGVKDITLIGQNVNEYRNPHHPAEDFVDLLKRVNQTGEVSRIRFTTSHPKDFSPRLARCFSELEALCPWLHLPLQSGSSRVLALMNRKYSRADYLEKIKYVRDLCPEIAIGTDLIVGFPGETEEDFQETLSIIEQIQFDYAYSFKFSPRPGTFADGLVETLTETEKLNRLRLLQSKQDQITENKLSQWVGKILPVLIVGPSRKGLPQLSGRSPGNHVVNIEATTAAADTLIGQIVQAKIIRSGKHSLFGELLPQPFTPARSNSQ